MNSPRIFEDTEAVRSAVPLFIGLTGPSGSGKSWTALELATGIQQVTGGDIYGIDTEACRMLHYADTFKFRHLPFSAPFNPSGYQDAVEHCTRKGAKIVIIDSCSHMHEGPGGTLESHSAELDRIAGDDWKKRDRCTMLAWQKPKAELRRFLNTILQLQVNVIFCFRAKEKTKIERGKEPTPLGFMPIAGDELIYEMTANLLLYPGSNGAPTLESNEVGERVIIKIPNQFKGLFRAGQSVNREHGRTLAEWSTGKATAKQEPARKAGRTEVSGYRAAVTSLSQSTGVEEKAIHAYLLEYALAKDWAKTPELKDGRPTQRGVFAALETAYAAHPEMIAEAEAFCSGEAEPGADG